LWIGIKSASNLFYKIINFHQLYSGK